MERIILLTMFKTKKIIYMKIPYYSQYMQTTILSRLVFIVYVCKNSLQGHRCLEPVLDFTKIRPKVTFKFC